MSAHTLSDILAIPGNEAVYKRLQKLLQEGSAITFVGAGASAPLYPLWPQLIAQLAHEPVARGLAADADGQYWLRNADSKPLQVASQIRARLGDPLYHTFLYETFKDRTGADGLTYTPAHAALMRASFKAYLTTNRRLWIMVGGVQMTLSSWITIPVQRIADICRRYQVRELAVFGSAARSDMRPDSDIDLLVYYSSSRRRKSVCSNSRPWRRSSQRSWDGR